MTDTALTITMGPAGEVAVLDLWNDTAPDLSGVVALRVEPRRWWVVGGCGTLAAALADHGSLTPIGGGLSRAVFSGPGWREALMAGGCFDAEDPAFATGDCAATLLHHVPVWIHVVTEEEAHVYCAASYAEALRHAWRLPVGHRSALSAPSESVIVAPGLAPARLPG